MSGSSPVLSVIIRKFRQADMDAANEVLARFEQALIQHPGFIEVRHNAPNSESSDAFSTVIAFASLDDLVAWEQSATRAELVEELSHFIEGTVVKNRLWDLDSLLGSGGGHQAPKKWKTVLVLTFWVLIVGAILSWIADIISPAYPEGYPRSVVLLIFNILLNSYFFLPRSMALLHRFENWNRTLED
jgi:antibiotic biosynthesis monooxygenase (ABM) superfamily enzyme